MKYIHLLPAMALLVTGCLYDPGPHHSARGGPPADDGRPHATPLLGAATLAVVGGVAAQIQAAPHDRAWAIPLGALIGAGVGAVGGYLMDPDDEDAVPGVAMAQAAAAEALSTAPTGRSVRWHDPEAGASGVVKPVSDQYRNGSGMICRDFEATTLRDNKTYQGQGTACRADGPARAPLVAE